MLTRFLQYSLERGKKIRVMLSENGALRARNILVIAYDETSVSCLVAGRKTALVLPLDAVLSASYARGDDGSDE